MHQTWHLRHITRCHRRHQGNFRRGNSAYEYARGISRKGHKRGRHGTFIGPYYNRKMSGHNIQDMIAEFKKRKEEFIQEMMKRDEEVKVKGYLPEKFRQEFSKYRDEEDQKTHEERLKEKRIWIVNYLEHIKDKKNKLEEKEEFLEECLKAVDHVLKKS